MNAMTGAYIGCNKNFQDESGVHAAPRIASFSLRNANLSNHLRNANPC